MKCQVKREKRNFISTSNHILFCLSYKHNSPLLTRKVYFTMIENKRLGNPRIKIVKCVGTVKMKTCVESLQKPNNGPNFQSKNSQIWIGPYRQKKSFRYAAKIGLWHIFRLTIFVLRREKSHHQSHSIRNFRFFFSYFGFLPLLGKFKRHCL